MKCCIKCNIEKEHSEFHKGKNFCKMCSSEKHKQYYQNNLEKEKKRSERYRQNNPEKVKEQNKQYRQDNAEKEKERKKLHYQNNPEKAMIRNARNRAKQKNLPFDIDETDIIIPALCPVFGIPLEVGVGKKTIQPNSPSLDRIIPEKGYVKGNIIVVSNKANAIKQNATPEEIMAVGEFYKKLLEEANKNE